MPAEVRLVGYRDTHADLYRRVWQGALLLSSGEAGLFAPTPPQPDTRAGWCRVLVAPGSGVAVFDDVDYVHRSARLSVAVLEAPEALLREAVLLARGGLQLHRVYGVLPDDPERAAAARAAGFVPEVTIPRLLWLGGEECAGSIWARCFEGSSADE